MPLLLYVYFLVKTSSLENVNKKKVMNRDNQIVRPLILRLRLQAVLGVSKHDGNLQKWEKVKANLSVHR